MSRDTSCVMKLTYFSPGNDLVNCASAPEDLAETVRFHNDAKLDRLLRGRRNVRSVREGINELGKTDHTIVKHGFFRNRQFQGYPFSS